MMHPHTEVRWASAQKGLGVFAVQPIPLGTVTFVADALDVVVSPTSRIARDPRYREILERYAYLDERGRMIVSWDHGKFVNHCCFANTLTTGYGFEIAVRDIAAGEEVTDDYGLFTDGHEMAIECLQAGCRRRVSGEDFAGLVEHWDRQILVALAHFDRVNQPLASLIDASRLRQVQRFVDSGRGYRSVRQLQPRLRSSEPTHAPFDLARA